MGQSLIGIISSQLAPEEIINMHENLNKDNPLGIKEENWHWEVEGISVGFLEEYWTRDEEWYVNELSTKRDDRIYKYPAIETASGWSILFFERNLMCISLPIKYSPRVSEDPGTETINAATKLAQYFNQNTMVLTYELGSGNTEEELKGSNFGSLSNMVDSFRRTSRDFYQIEF